MESAEGIQANATPGAQATDHAAARHISHVPEVVEASMLLKLLLHHLASKLETFIPALPMVVKWEAAFIVLLVTSRLQSILPVSNPSPSDSSRCPSWLLSSLSPLVTGHLRRPTAECVAPRTTSPGYQVLRKVEAPPSMPHLYPPSRLHQRYSSQENSVAPRRCKASKAQPGARHSSSGQGASA